MRNPTCFISSILHKGGTFQNLVKCFVFVTWTLLRGVLFSGLIILSPLERNNLNQRAQSSDSGNKRFQDKQNRETKLQSMWIKKWKRGRGKNTLAKSSGTIGVRTHDLPLCSGTFRTTSLLTTWNLLGRKIEMNLSFFGNRHWYMMCKNVSPPMFPHSDQTIFFLLLTFPHSWMVFEFSL